MSRVRVHFDHTTHRWTVSIVTTENAIEVGSHKRWRTAWAHARALTCTDHHDNQPEEVPC